MSEIETLSARLRDEHRQTTIHPGVCICCRGPWPCSGIEAAAEIDRLRPGCTCTSGPDYEGPEEDCPEHGRSHDDLWRLLCKAEAERDALRAALDRVLALADAASTYRAMPGYVLVRELRAAAEIPEETT